MCDIFLPEDVGRIFKDQHVVVIGGSFMRGVYKDLIWLLNHASLMPREILGAKMEAHFPDFENAKWKNGREDPELTELFNKDNRDTLLDNNGLIPGRTYIEPRRYYNKQHNVTIVYKFIVRVCCDELEDFLYDYKGINKAPINTIIMNSALWDFNRWGPYGPEEYKENFAKLIELVRDILPCDGEFTWLTCPMGAHELDSKGMGVPGLDFQKFSSRYNVIEANYAATSFVRKAGFGVVDIHYLLQLQTFRRNRDGIHWEEKSNRLVTNLLLTQLVLWREGEHALPGRVKDNYALDMVKLRAKIAREGSIEAPEVKSKLEELEQLPIVVLTVGDEGRVNSMKGAVTQMLTAFKKAAVGSEVKAGQQQTRFHPYQRQTQLPPGLNQWGVNYGSMGGGPAFSSGPEFKVPMPPVSAAAGTSSNFKSFAEDEPLVGFQSRSNEMNFAEHTRQPGAGRNIESQQRSAAQDDLQRNMPMVQVVNPMFRENGGGGGGSTLGFAGLSYDQEAKIFELRLRKKILQFRCQNDDMRPSESQLRNIREEVLIELQEEAMRTNPTAGMTGFQDFREGEESRSSMRRDNGGSLGSSQGVMGASMNSMGNMEGSMSGAGSSTGGMRSLMDIGMEGSMGDSMGSMRGPMGGMGISMGGMGTSMGGMGTSMGGMGTPMGGMGNSMGGMGNSMGGMSSMGGMGTSMGGSMGGGMGMGGNGMGMADGGYGSFLGPNWNLGAPGTSGIGAFMAGMQDFNQMSQGQYASNVLQTAVRRFGRGGGGGRGGR